uniref:Cilia- and flagella-associated protein 263 n=1 Tax=Dicentrarchus labrax TaxID=13489 RepID=A0A8C4NU75_DICLA
MILKLLFLFTSTHPRCSNAALLAENNMLERFIGRLDPQDLVSQAGADGPGASGASQLEGGLTLEQKLNVVQREVTETRQDQEKLKQRYERIQDNYKASLKEAELRLAEIRKAKNEFERRLIKPMMDNRLEMKEHEKVLQYTEDKSKVKRLMKTTQSSFSLSHRTLLQLVKPICACVCVCVCQQEKLRRVTLESTELSNDISNRKQMLTKIEEEIQHAEEERIKAEALNKHLRRQMTDYQAPDIIEYMHVKDKHKKLQQSIHTLERKVGIAQMALKTHAKAWSTQGPTLTPAYSAEARDRSGGHQIPVKLPYIAEHST